MFRSTTLRLCAVTLLTALSMLLTACPATPKQADMAPDDLAMLRGAQLIGDAIRAYQRETAELPGALRDAEPFLLRGETWPANPYTRQPIEEAASAEFDATASVGKVFYEKFARDGVVVNYRLHVFGKAGELAVLENRPGSLR